MHPNTSNPFAPVARPEATRRRNGPVRLIVAMGLTAVLLAGCGGGNDGEDSGGVPAESTVGSGSPPPSPSTSESQTHNDTSAPEADSLPVPPEGPSTITEFPIPGGAVIVDLGPPDFGNWQFGISAPDFATTLEFYRTTLAAQGYTLRENVPIFAGSDVEYELAFFGPTYGVVFEGGVVLDGTLVTVSDRPIDGIEP
ncbi:hypothetical protein BH18ACT4_BH18ACT4_00900 [soil metagenome]